VLLFYCVVLTVAFLLAAEIGAFVFKRLGGQSRPTSGIPLDGATALLGLLIGFTFVMAADRFETRRELVVAEANALSTTYLRDAMLPEPSGARLGALLSDYGRTRLAFFDAREDKALLARSAARTSLLQDAIWKETTLALRAPQAAPLATAVLTTTNEMFDLAASRQAALDARVPAPMFALLIFCGLITAALNGYNMAAQGPHHRVAVTSFLVMVAVSIVVVEDLDTPRSGFVTVPQGPMINCVADIGAREARRETFTLPDSPQSSAGTSAPQ